MAYPINPDRLPQWRIAKGTPKGAMVTIPSMHPDDLALFSTTDTVMVLLADGTVASKQVGSLERVFRTKAEKELGHDWTPEEEEANTRAAQQRIDEHLVERSAQAVREGILLAAERLERVAADLRHSLTLADSTPPQLVEHAQHEVLWMVPNMDLQGMGRDATKWAEARARLGESARG